MDQDRIDRLIQAINELDSRQYKVLFSTGPDAKFTAEDLHPQDRVSGAFHQLDREIAAAVRGAFDAGLSITSIYQRTPLSRRRIQEALEKTKPAAREDVNRADELARRTKIYAFADYLSRDLGEMLRAERDADVDVSGLVRKFKSFFRAWLQVQRRAHEGDTDALAVLSALDSNVRNVLSDKTLAFWASLPKRNSDRTDPPARHW